MGGRYFFVNSTELWLSDYLIYYQ